MAQGPQQQTGTHEIWVVLAVLPLISCNLQQAFLLLNAFACCLFLFLCCQLLVIKGKERKGTEVVTLFLPVSWALPRVVHGQTMGQRRNLRAFPATKQSLSHIQTTSYLLCSSKNSELFEAKMQPSVVLCSF